MLDIFHFKKKYFGIHVIEKSRIRETPTLLTDADGRTDKNLKRLPDLSPFFKGTF